MNYPSAAEPTAMVHCLSSAATSASSSPTSSSFSFGHAASRVCCSLPSTGGNLSIDTQPSPNKVSRDAPANQPISTSRPVSKSNLLPSLVLNPDGSKNFVLTENKDILSHIPVHTVALNKPLVTNYRTSKEILKELYIPHSIHHEIDQQPYFNLFKVSIYSHIGNRKHQEDRFVLCPKLIANRSDAALFGVFDGTVGEFAADTVKLLVIPHLIDSSAWKTLVQELDKCINCTSEQNEKRLLTLLWSAIDHMYKAADAELLNLCDAKHLNYTSSTSVIAVLVRNFLAVGHLGDSRLAIGRCLDNLTIGEFVTFDHKPDQEIEKARIINSGGSVEYLYNHNNKPFIRGGDFIFRKHQGEQPMQLQYSRAFGGKDLKNYGLSNQADIKILKIDETLKCIILASDGLWDVQSAQNAIDIALTYHNSKNPAKILVEMTLNLQKKRRQMSDNITAMVVFLN